jgi:NAD(P)-dependent dehydrogenase (short-subunit alcohol dehydrogenase family)
MKTTVKPFNGQVALVTGGTDGIGKQVALRLADGGAQVILVGRDAQKGAATLEQMRAIAPGASCQFQGADLSQMREVVRLAEALRTHGRLDVVVHCAGVMLRNRTLTAEGLETVFAVQYLARMLLTQRVMPLLHASPNPRIVDVSAGGTINLPFDFDNLQGEKQYDGVHALRHESVANDMLVLELQARYPAMRFYNYGPGVVRTTLLRDMPALLRLFAGTFGALISISSEQAADDILTLLTHSPESGLYGRKGRRNDPSPFKADAANRARLWEMSQALIAHALAQPLAQP